MMQPEGIGDAGDFSMEILRERRGLERHPYIPIASWPCHPGEVGREGAGQARPRSSTRRKSCESECGYACLCMAIAGGDGSGGATRRRRRRKSSSNSNSTSTSTHNSNRSSSSTSTSTWYAVSKRMSFAWACKRDAVEPCQDGACMPIPVLILGCCCGDTPEWLSPKSRPTRLQIDPAFALKRLQQALLKSWACRR
ncbi:hypothetical protein BD289DRAFT_172949 [Coniella lustricola]|uniref:Uncharacterized protein n=1 Tax=Coniella lustricola TaxID=2025994 RepID=A0A2T2ZTR1_9PEZI|nr:hypothetical protein BD289DRAFT_172949 [Coniella lustricola]